MTQTTENIQQPNAVYKFERATVRIHGTCTNIREETERFLKQVVRKVPPERRKSYARKEA